MLTAAGIGVAMGNAGESLKAHADYVTDRLDCDGLAKAFARYHLC
jgi:hydroxymethylpyrimidine pyrophosphatase-like HAD family hydrolase